MTTFTCNGRMSASGIGSEALAYKKLLFNLCTTGLTLTAIKVRPRAFNPTIIEYTVEGSNEQIDHLNRLVNDG